MTAVFDVRGRDSLVRDSLGSAASGRPPLPPHSTPAAALGGSASRSQKLAQQLSVREDASAASASEVAVVQNSLRPAQPTRPRVGPGRSGSTLVSSLLAGDRTMMSDLLDTDTLEDAAAPRGKDRLSSATCGDEFDF